MNPAMIPMMVCQTVIFAGRALLMLSPDTRWKWTEWGVSTVQSHHDQIHAFEVQRHNSQSIIIFCREHRHCSLQLYKTSKDGCISFKKCWKEFLMGKHLRVGSTMMITIRPSAHEEFQMMTIINRI